MNKNPMEKLSNLVSDCGQQLCPLYSAFLNQPNAQSTYRVDQLQWSLKYKPPKFSTGSQKFGAKLVLLMESPPPVYLEYFYGPEGGFQKQKGLFANVMKLLLKVEGPPIGFKELDPQQQLELLNDKAYWLHWAAELGLVVIDATKCRLKISDVLSTDKVSKSQAERAFHYCGDILKTHLQLVDPFRIAIGIVSVYDSAWQGRPLILELLQDIGFQDRLIKKRTASIWAWNNEEFQQWFPEVWNQTKVQFNQLKQRV